MANNNYTTSANSHLSVLRSQEETLPFTEKPSDKHDLGKEGHAFLETRQRRNPFELFSLFTADIIKKNVVYTR